MRVLVVEDEARLALLLKRGLAEEGYAVDVMLPSLDGVEVTRRLRAGKRWVPVLLLTARDTIDDRVAGLDAGADDYLPKPFSFAELAARVRALVRRGRIERPTVLEVGGLRLDPARRQAWRGEVELELSPKEFALLELFLAHPGQVLTRTRILEHVWDFAYDPASNVVDQYVGYLRRKVDRPLCRADLETVRGAGYRLREPKEP